MRRQKHASCFRIKPKGLQNSSLIGNYYAPWIKNVYRIRSANDTSIESHSDLPTCPSWLSDRVVTRS